MALERKFLTLNVRCSFTTEFHSEFRVKIADGKIEEIDFGLDRTSDIESILILNCPNRVYFFESEPLIMINNMIIATAFSRRAANI